MPLVVSPNVSPTHRSKYSSSSKNNKNNSNGGGIKNTIKLLGFGLLCFAAGIHFGRGSTVFNSASSVVNSNGNAVETVAAIATPSTTREKPHRLFTKDNNNNDDGGGSATESSDATPPVDTTVVNNDESEVVDEEIISSTNNSINEQNKNDKPVEKIVVLGERHSGTNWIEDYLRECFDVQVCVVLLLC